MISDELVTLARARGLDMDALQRIVVVRVLEARAGSLPLGMLEVDYVESFVRAVLRDENAIRTFNAIEEEIRREHAVMKEIVEEQS